MCGRYTLTQVTDLERVFPDVAEWTEDARSFLQRPHYNIAPGQPVLTVVRQGDRLMARTMRWGFIPHWAREARTGYRMINARAEGLARRPAFRFAFRSHRCLIPADGFYEWMRVPGERTKVPVHIRRKDDRPFAFAGLYSVWRDPEGRRHWTVTIVTTAPNELLRPIHNRMPVILDPAVYARWLDPELRDPDRLIRLLRPYPADRLQAYRVSRRVNSPTYDAPDCIAPEPKENE